MEIFKGPAHPDYKTPARLEVVAIPTEQAILAEDEDIIRRFRQGTLVGLIDPHSPEEPLWDRFVAERSLSDDFRIPFYEARIRRAKRKAAKYAAALFYKPKFN